MGPRRSEAHTALLWTTLTLVAWTTRAQLSCPTAESDGRSNDKVAENSPPPAKKFVAGGTPAEACRYPYMASLNMVDSGVPHICGGTLVHESWILTAASCVDKKFLRRTNPVASLNGLLLGRPETFQENIPTVEADLHIHPKYDGNLVSGYNVALLKLETPSKQPPITLMAADDALEPGELLGLIGWGRTGGNGAFSTDLLEALDVELEGPDVCAGFGAKEAAMVSCAGGAGQNVCQGDEGGPVLRRGEDASRDVQVGVATSQLDQCGLFGMPSKFTVLQHLVDWIDDIVNGGR